MAKKQHFYLILILGSLAALGPFSIDMYLPGFVDIAKDLGSNESTVALSLSSFFIGISAGQLLYGPLLDKFGRKKPLYFGLALYIFASFLCLAVTDVNQLIVLRFVQAIGSCATAVASIAMVRDLFSVEESPKVFASLMLVIAVSPMLAPTAGGYLISALGWKYVFVFLGLMAVLMLLASIFKLPESYKPDPNYSLKPKPILTNFFTVLKEPQFYTYALISSITFSGLFAYVSSSPQVFMKIYEVSKTGYGWIFALLSVAFIGSSQVNSLILRWFTSKKIVTYALIAQCIFSLIFLIFALNNWLSLYSTIGFIAFFLACLGLINPNAAALSLAPFTKNAGSASALMGALQMGLGALASVMVSLFSEHSVVPMPLVMTAAAFIALFCLLIGRRFITTEVETSNDTAVVAH
ncbi:multidrug effflux MFS transporter [Pedobacter alluvionis]|uniref:Bcr/CflA family efflux MFS transporter n=1 Tax=Pedobacter alluvionis TaxID=475253 RepID=A0A497XT55_9SPHI|nr:multidrug effflux MFS transporter [Pedobacter alluvionis]RLJ72578.1 DHA1 family bicyclomycin/chloramphenicol resistance-like MFS transporter [Pedobacter alluvionis]TFB28104.1 Bcr/CflA family efflux MFS transporter [Pedobacter alluvionis]